MTDKQIDLLVRANVQGKKDLDGVAKSVAGISDALDKQGDAAKRGQKNLDEIQGSLAALAQENKRLGESLKMVTGFEKLNDQIVRTETAIAKAQKNYETFTAAMIASGTATKEQTDQQNKLSATLNAAEARLEKYRAKLPEAAQGLRDLGLSTDDLAGSQNRVKAAIEATAAVMAKGSAIITTYAADVRAARDAATAQADADKNAAKIAADAARARATAIDAVTAALKKRATAQNEVDNRRSEVAGNSRADAEQRAAITRAQELASLRQDIIDRSEAASAASKRTGEAAGSSRADAEQNAAIERSRELLALRQDIESRSKQAFVDVGLRGLADDAEKSTRALSTLEKASTNLKAPMVSLRDSVNAILNPSQAMRSTLSGLETEVSTLATTIGQIKGPVSDYRDTLQKLEATQRTIGKQSSLVDDFAKQSAALRTARAEFTTARAAVSQYADAVRQGGSEGAGFVKALSEAQASARAAAIALKDQLVVTRESRDALRAAGIASNDLAAAQSRLTSAASSTVTSTQQLTAAVKEYGTAQEKAFTPKGDGERTTLGLLQRIKGEVLSLTASYVGLFGAIEAAKGSLDAIKARESARNQISISTGMDKNAIDAEMAYVKAQSDRIGVNEVETRKGFAKFATSAKLSGASAKEIRYVFESFTEASRVMGLSAEETGRVFKALDQIYSKGTLQAEEVKNQLGDVLPGIFEVAQKALKDKFPNLQQAMKDGLVTTDQLVKVAMGYRDVVADQLPAAMKSLGAQQERMNNALNDFKLAVADGGWADAYSSALASIVDFMKSADGQAAAKAFAGALTELADVFTFIVKNANSAKTVLELLFVAFTASQLTTFIGYLQKAVLGLAAMPAVIAPTTASFTTLAGAVDLVGSALTRIVALGAAFIGGWQLGTWLRSEFTVVRTASTQVVTWFAEMFAQIQFYVGAFSDVFTMGISNAINFALTKVANGVKTIIGWTAKIARAAGQDDLAKSLELAAVTVAVEYKDIDAAVAKRKAALNSELKNISDIRQMMLKDDVNGPKTAVSNDVSGTATAFPGVTPRAPIPNEGDAKKLESLIDSIRGSLDSLEAGIDRAQTETLQKQLDAIDMRYEKVRDNIEKLRKLSPAAADEALTRLIALNIDARTVATNKFNKGLTDDFKTLTAELANAEAATGRKSKDDLDKRQAAIAQGYTGLYQKIADIRAKYQQNDMPDGVAQADTAKAALDGYIAELQALEATKVAKEKLTKLEASMNDQIKTRDAQLAAVNAQKEAGAITDVQAAEQLNTINANALPGIVAAGEATKAWALANTAVFANTTDQETFIAFLDATIAKQSQVVTQFSDLGKAGIKGAVDGINVGLNSMADNLGSIVNGQQDLAGGFANVRDAFMGFAATFLRQIAMMIIQQAIFNAMKNSNGGVGILADIGKSALGVKHDGGVVGVNGQGNRTRSVATSWFANAPRYHTGGVPGLKPDEYATILQKGEEVLANDSPRNIMNGGMSGGAKQADASGMRVVLVDDRSKVHEAMASADGERVIVQALRRNLPSIKQMIRS